jgi:hypothetical protein
VHLTEPAPSKPVNSELRSQAELVEQMVSHYHKDLRRDLPVVWQHAWWMSFSSKPNLTT